MILGSGCTPGSAFSVVGRDSREGEFTTYTDDDIENWDFADGPVDFQVDVRVCLRQGFHAIREFLRLANFAAPEDGRGVFRLALQNLNAIAKCDSVTLLAVRAVALEHLHVVEETAAVSVDG